MENGAEQYAEADLLADKLFEDLQYVEYQKGVPALIGGLAPPFYSLQ